MKLAEITVIETPIDGLYIIEPKIFGDNRGYFFETYNRQVFFDAGLDMSFVQDNESHSKKGVLRGLHMQAKKPQGKLVRAISGEVYDVAVDARKESRTYGQWHGVVLSAENKRMFYIPEGFLHGFLVLSESATFTYKCTHYYDPSDEYGVMWDDPAIGIEWPKNETAIILSEKDKQNHSFNEYSKMIGEKNG